jgi:diguanylate cyclase (GGDEF)-like protein
MKIYAQELSMSHRDKGHFDMLFEHAPISLWEEDYTGIKLFFDNLRAQGVTDLDAYLALHPDQIETCMRRIQVLDVNQRTVKLFGAASKADLLANLDRILRGDMRSHFRAELLALWNGETSWDGEGINYTLQGQPVNIRLHWRVLPGFEETLGRLLVTIEDITALKQAERRFQSLFEAAPISIWQEDYSALKQYFDALCAQGVTDLKDYVETHPDIVPYCMGLLKVLDVNQKTLELFKADSREHLLTNLGQVFRDEMGHHFIHEMLDLWNGRLAYQQEGINYALDGEPINVLVDVRVMPGHEDDFAWVQVAIQDITLRKKAENYLRYLGTHDALTGVYNRAYFEDQLLHLAEAKSVEKIGFIMADLNGLKVINDRIGHQAGDNFIRRAAEVLKAAFGEGETVARIGGDEFAVLALDVTEEDMVKAVERIRSLIPLNNKYYQGPELSMALGYAIHQLDESMEKTFGRADQNMYKEKDRHYQAVRR